MLKEALRALDAGILPEIGLLAFVFAFVLVVARALLMKKESRDAAKRLPLEDAPALHLQPNGHHEQPVS